MGPFVLWDDLFCDEFRGTICGGPKLWTVTLKKTVERDEIANAFRLQRILSSIIRVKKTCIAGKKKRMKRAIEKHNADYLIGLAAQRPFRHGLSSIQKHQ